MASSSLCFLPIESSKRRFSRFWLGSFEFGHFYFFRYLPCGRFWICSLIFSRFPMIQNWFNRTMFFWCNFNDKVSWVVMLRTFKSKVFEKRNNTRSNAKTVTLSKSSKILADGWCMVHTVANRKENPDLDIVNSS